MGKGNTMKTYLTINKRRYEAREFDFNLICDMQDMGIDILDMTTFKNNPISAIRAYASLCIGADKEVAGMEIQEHVVGGGGFDEILSVMQKMMEESDFFRALNKNAEEKDQPDQKEEKDSAGAKQKSK